MKILTILGTRPEVIKLAPVIKEIRKRPNLFASCVCLTGQHKEMVEPFLKTFKIKADYNLKIMKPSQDLYDVTVRTLDRIKKIFKKEKPDLIICQGDTTTAFSAALAAYYEKIPLAHVEAGLRSGAKYNPYPEEKNRELIDHLSDLLFAPTKRAKKNLLDEGINEKKIFITGNTVIDSLFWLLKHKKAIKEKLLKKIGISQPIDKFILVTSHRRESFGKDLENIFKAFKRIVKQNKNFNIIYPVHLNPNVRKPAFRALKNQKRIHLVAPLDYIDFLNLMSYAHIVITDSGGVIEEAPSLNKPVLIIRKRTERQEAVEAGCAKLVGTNTANIVKNTEKLIKDYSLYKKMAQAKNPFGDGKAGQRIIKIIQKNGKG